VKSTQTIWKQAVVANLEMLTGIRRTEERGEGRNQDRKSSGPHRIHPHLLHQGPRERMNGSLYHHPPIHLYDVMFKHRDSFIDIIYPN
jgi:hypothetical protein